MKKFILKTLLFIVLLVALLLGLTGCKEKANTDNTEKYNIANFECLCRHIKGGGAFTVIYYVDVDTNLIYMYYTDNFEYSGDGFTLYYNKDGKPMTRSEFEKTHMKDYHKDN